MCETNNETYECENQMMYTDSMKNKILLGVWEKSIMLIILGKTEITETHIKIVKHGNQLNQCLIRKFIKQTMKSISKHSVIAEEIQMVEFACNKSSDP